MSDLEKELMLVGITNESNQLVIPGQVKEEFDGTLNSTLKIESATDNTNQETPKYAKPEKIRCTECDRYTTTDPDLLIRHIRKVHRGENPFQCVMCDYSTYNKAVFEDHVRWHQGIKPFKCSMCEYRSVSKNNLTKHEKNHKNHQCPKCGKVLSSKKSFDNHMTKHNNGETSQNGEHKCRHCDTEFPNKRKLQYHQKTYVKKCDNCFVKLCSTAMRIKHMADVHNQYFYKTDLKRKRKSLFLWMCQVCKWEAKNEQKALLHLIHHPNQKVDTSILDLTPLLKCNIMPVQ